MQFYSPPSRPFFLLALIIAPLLFFRHLWISVVIGRKKSVPSGPFRQMAPNFSKFVFLQIQLTDPYFILSLSLRSYIATAAAPAYFSAYK